MPHATLTFHVYHDDLPRLRISRTAIDARDVEYHIDLEHDTAAQLVQHHLYGAVTVVTYVGNKPHEDPARAVAVITRHNANHYRI